MLIGKNDYNQLFVGSHCKKVSQNQHELVPVLKGVITSPFSYPYPAIDIHSRLVHPYNNLALNKLIIQLQYIKILYRYLSRKFTECFICNNKTLRFILNNEIYFEIRYLKYKNLSTAVAMKQAVLREKALIPATMSPTS